MNPGTLSLVIFAVFGFGLTGLVIWLERRFQQRSKDQDRSPD